MYVKTFKEFMLNETVYQLGIGGDGVYSNRINSSIKSKTISILKSRKWERTDAGKWALENAKRLADMWNAKDPDKIPSYISKRWRYDSEGKVSMSSFISTTALIVAVLDVLSKKESAQWIQAGGTRNQCFANSIKWAQENEGKPIGGICIPKKQLGVYAVESLVVHAFSEKNRKFYEVTIPSVEVTKGLIYWPLITFDNNVTEEKVSQDIWTYALGIEEGVKEYVKNI